MSRTLDPTLYRRKLSVELRRLREKAELKQRAAAQQVEWSLSKLIRIESGTVGVSVTDLRALLALYGVDDAELTESLLEAARGTKRQPWYSAYQKVVPHSFAQYLSFESAASSIVTSQPILFPGLLQTDDYAFALLSDRMAYEEARMRVDLRMERQDRIFDADEGPEISFLIDESMLYRTIGSPALMREQLRRVLDRLRHPKVSLRIMPLSAGVHPLLTTSFTALSVTDDDDMVFTEEGGGSLLIRDDAEVIVRYHEQFEDSWQRALSGDAVTALLNEAIERFGAAAGS
jgi:transcriptional regulator with XRE-family HTH domain